MSAQMEMAPEELVHLTIDGIALQGRKGDMIIQVADAAEIPIPRFCYHEKLPIAANCRMCLVDVEKAPKPVPACATPITEGMVVRTRSERALSAQRAVMEFLLINHPLDCPICDQGGECELQDLALGFGRSVSRFTERKRIVVDEDLGPLIATDMTRCIHCTRCIRTLELVAGAKELGATGRGEDMRIGTYIGRHLDSEMSGNVIDVCPVGALTSKPYRYSARAWELESTDGVGPHDSVGSNLVVHSLRGRVKRVVPGENEAINEVWLADRDRFSYAGLAAADRLETPLVRDRGDWQGMDWEVALEAAAEGLRGIVERSGPEQVGFLIHPSTTVEELFLLQKLARGLGCANIDHRLRQGDFRDQDRLPAFPWLGQSIADLERAEAVLLVGSNVQHDQPIVAHRLRKAAMAGGRLMFINPLDYSCNLPTAETLVAPPREMLVHLGALARSLADRTGTKLPKGIPSLVTKIEPTGEHDAIAASLLAAGDAGTILFGSQALAHPELQVLRALGHACAELTGARIGYLPEAANSVGAWLAGCVPHRAPGGAPAPITGLDVRTMLDEPRQAYVLVGLDPERDLWDSAAATRALSAAEFVIGLSAFAGEGLRAHGNILLPIGAFAETSGTFLNMEGHWQSFAGAVPPPGQARPGWKVLRVLGNLLEIDGFGYLDSTEIRDELRGLCGEVEPSARLGPVTGLKMPGVDPGLVRVGDMPMYAVDPLTRRSAPLQATGHGAEAVARIHPEEAARQGLAEGARVLATQGEHQAELPLELDPRVPPGTVWIPAGVEGSQGLGPSFGPVELVGA
jgi:NADH-quinone oxidoreductase subunit G